MACSINRSTGHRQTHWQKKNVCICVCARTEMKTWLFDGIEPLFVTYLSKRRREEKTLGLAAFSSLKIHKIFFYHFCFVSNHLLWGSVSNGDVCSILFLFLSFYFFFCHHLLLAFQIFNILSHSIQPRTEFC